MADETMDVYRVEIETEAKQTLAGIKAAYAQDYGHSAAHDYELRFLDGTDTLSALPQRGILVVCGGSVSYAIHSGVGKWFISYEIDGHDLLVTVLDFLPNGPRR